MNLTPTQGSNYYEINTTDNFVMLNILDFYSILSNMVVRLAASLSYLGE